MSMSGRADEHRWGRWASEGHQRSLMSIAGAVVGCGGGLVGVWWDKHQRSRMSISRPADEHRRDG